MRRHRPRVGRGARMRWTADRISLGLSASGRQWKKYYKQVRRAIADGVRNKARAV